MVLADVKHYLRQHRQASLCDLALHFETDPDAMRGMLALWVRKGKVIKTDLKGGCGGGCKSCRCDPATLEIYTWQV